MAHIIQGRAGMRIIRLIMDVWCVHVLHVHVYDVDVPCTNAINSAKSCMQLPEERHQNKFMTGRTITR